MLIKFHIEDASGGSGVAPFGGGVVAVVVDPGVREWEMFVQIGLDTSGVQGDAQHGAGQKMIPPIMPRHHPASGSMTP